MTDLYSGRDDLWAQRLACHRVPFGLLVLRRTRPWEPPWLPPERLHWQRVFRSSRSTPDPATAMFGGSAQI